MERNNETPTYVIFKTLMIRIFSSRCFIVIFDLVMTFFISIHSAKLDSANIPDEKLIIYALLQIAINIVCIFAGHIDRKGKKFIYYSREAYNVHNNINFNMAGRLFEANEITTNAIQNMKRKKDSIKLLIDFQKLSQNMCDELYDFVKLCFNYEECEISIFQRFVGEQGDFVKMIAYKNNNKESSTPEKTFRLDNVESKKYVFSKLFNDLEAKVIVLPDKDTIGKEFSWLEGSEDRERKICQYIGVPIKTKRNKVEIILQIDVSKEKILGKDENELTEFAENIIRPFSNLLYCCYERDLIFNKFYDILEENVPLEEV